MMHFNIIKKSSLFMVFFSLLWAGLAHAEEPSTIDAGVEGNASEVVKIGPSLDELLDQVAEAMQFKDYKIASELYRKIHRDFPGLPEAAEALWYYAELQKKLAIENGGEWEEVRDAYKDFISYYPGSGNVPRAYFEVGVALYFMRFQRESQSYFKLCIKKFPDNELVGEAESWQLKILIEIGRISEAKKKIDELSNHKIAKVRLRAKVRMAEIYNLEKDFYSSLNIYHELAGRNSDFFLDAPESLRIFGQANLLAGNVTKGRDQLIYYLNLAEYQTNRSDIFFDIAESYWREKKYQVAKKMYDRAIEYGVEGRRPVVLSKMRISQYFDDPLRQLGKWEKPRDLKDPQGDDDYLKVLDLFYEDPISQDARASLFQRFAARGDLESMRDYGKNFLRIARLSEIDADEKQKAGQILLSLAEKLHAEEKHQGLYELYFSEHQHVKDFPNGRFLYLVGQAMDALAMYDQAAVIYYRALKWPLTKDDKIDLYFRRANVYLIRDDFVSAERLLKYLREIYYDTNEFGEVLWYSGKLREAQKSIPNALDFYLKAVEQVDSTEKKAEYALDVIRLFLDVKDGKEAYSMINSYKKEGWLVGSGLQQLYAKAADKMRTEGQCRDALDAYNSALAENLPQEGKIAQAAHLYMGDCLVAINEEENGVAEYNKAVEGDDKLLKQMAQERLNQKEIEQALSILKSGKGS